MFSPCHCPILLIIHTYTHKCAQAQSFWRFEPLATNHPELHSLLHLAWSGSWVRRWESIWPTGQFVSLQFTPLRSYSSSVTLQLLLHSCISLKICCTEKGAPTMRQCPSVIQLYLLLLGRLRDLLRRQWVWLSGAQCSWARPQECPAIQLPLPPGWKWWWLLGSRTQTGKGWIKLIKMHCKYSVSARPAWLYFAHNICNNPKLGKIVPYLKRLDISQIDWFPEAWLKRKNSKWEEKTDVSMLALNCQRLN